MEMMRYCPPGVSIRDVWINNGLSECLMDTVSSVTIALFLLSCGAVQLWMYRRYSSRNQHASRITCLYILQMSLTFFLSMMALLRFLLQTFLLNHGQVYGYMVVYTVLTVVVFPLSAALILLERHYQLPSVPSRGHGLILLLFWTLVFIFENITFFNLDRKDWWFHPNSLTDKVEMALFVSRYCACLLLFSLGLKAPGIVLHTDYVNLSSSNILRDDTFPSQSSKGIKPMTTMKRFDGQAPAKQPSETSALKHQHVGSYSSVESNASESSSSNGGGDLFFQLLVTEMVIDEIIND